MSNSGLFTRTTVSASIFSRNYVDLSLHGAAVPGFHPDELFDAVGIEKDEELLRYYLLMDELF